MNNYTITLLVPLICMLTLSAMDNEINIPTVTVAEGGSLMGIPSSARTLEACLQLLSFDADDSLPFYTDAIIYDLEKIKHGSSPHDRDYILPLIDILKCYPRLDSEGRKDQREAVKKAFNLVRAEIIDKNRDRKS